VTIIEPVPTVVFIADKETVGVNELYAALYDGFSVVKLSGTIPPGTDVIDFKISPDGTRVAFRVGQVLPPVPIELYVSDIDGGTPPAKVSGPLALNGNVEVLPALNFDAFGWSPDSTMIAYIADQNVGDGDVYELFVWDGSTNFPVSGALVSGGLVLEFEWAPDSSLIAYRATQDIAGVRELYTNLPSAISTAVKVSSPLGGGSDVDAPSPTTTDAFQWAPDSSLIAYLADVTNDVFELFTTLPDGSGVPDKVSADLSGSLDVNEFKWAPDSSLIAYIADQDSNDVFELFTAKRNIALPTVFDPPVQVSGAMHTDLDGGDVLDFEWAPDSSLIAYRADQDFNEVIELYASQPSVTSTFTKVNILIPDGDPRDVDVILGSNEDVFEWSPDSSSIAYIADQESDDIFEIFTAELTSIMPPAFDTPIKVHPDLTGNEDVQEFKWAPDSSRIAYRANQVDVAAIELFSTLLSALPDPSANSMISGPLTPGGNVDTPPGSSAEIFVWAPDNSRIAYLADQVANDVFELFSSLADGSGNGNISGPIDPGGDVSAFEYEP
jgi:Tol biopolymer transport system component